MFDKGIMMSKYVALTYEAGLVLNEAGAWLQDCCNSCAPIDEKKAEIYAKRLMEHFGWPFRRVVFADSPVHALRLRNEICKQAGITVCESHQAGTGSGRRVIRRIDLERLFVDPIRDILEADLYDSILRTFEPLTIGFKQAARHISEAGGYLGILSCFNLVETAAMMYFFRNAFSGDEANRDDSWVVLEAMEFGGVDVLEDTVVVGRRPTFIRSNYGSYHNVAFVGDNRELQPALTYRNGLVVYSTGRTFIPPRLVSDSQTDQDPVSLLCSLGGYAIEDIISFLGADFFWRRVASLLQLRKNAKPSKPSNRKKA
jgi:hypothetical protein